MSNWNNLGVILVAFISVILFVSDDVFAMLEENFPDGVVLYLDQTGQNLLSPQFLKPGFTALTKPFTTRYLGQLGLPSRFLFSVVG